MIRLDLGYIFNNQERSAGIVRMCINIHNKIHTKMVNALFLYIAVYFEILDIKSWPHTLYSLKPGRRLRRRLYRLWLGRCWVRSQTVNIRHVWYSRSCVRLPLEWIEVGRQPMRSSGAGSVGGRVLHNLTATQPSSQTDPLFFFFCPFIINVEDNSKLDSQLKTFFCLIFLTEVTIHLTSICERVHRRIVTANSRVMVSYSGPLVCMFKFYTVT